MAPTFSNHLIHESSPYLLQHAHNPVEWYPWGPEALLKARELDLPILVSIGYAACHWCHVMERESFEDEEVAKYMNEHFINIKIDREERPDLDHIYMDAVQAIAGNGGWPLNVFLTTDAKPFYGGTYFPPQKAFNRPSWKDVLANIHNAWNTRRGELIFQAEKLVEHISSSGNLPGKDNVITAGGPAPLFTKEQCNTIAENILKTADTVHGGFGAAPKFPQTFTIQYLLLYSYFFKHEKALAHAEFSLQQMLNGGIYDHLAGGLARYSTDNRWLAPHFEKMLYDNALLVSVLADAYQVTNNKIYEDAIHKTLGFFINEMKQPNGGYYAALDADSEGVEGKFYVWDEKEISHILGADAGLYCKWFGVSKNGNWEGKNILNITRTEEIFVAENHISIESLHALINKGNETLLKVRNKRPRPITDDKILLGWNALLITAFCKASAALGNEYYKEQAVSLFDFVMEKFSKAGMILFHTYKNNEAKHPAFLDDYAYLIQSCIHLQEITASQEYLLEAKKITNYVIDNFENKENELFYFTHKDQSDVITRKVEFYDGAVPSGNSIMAGNLFYLSVVFEQKDWLLKAQNLTKIILEIVVKHPGSFAIWAGIILKQAVGINEIVVTGKNPGPVQKDILKLYIPNKVFQCSSKEAAFPLLALKTYGETPLIYVCKNYKCLAPIKEVNMLKTVIEKPD
ncbi:MAG: thioredoxin domain-containing protein [Ferruginibacter sp.]